MKQPRSPYHIQTIETRTAMVSLSSLPKGAVFLKDGTPHIKVEVSWEDNHKPATDTQWIVNLVSGSCWGVGDIEVYSATDVSLTYKSNRP